MQKTLNFSWCNDKLNSNAFDFIKAYLVAGLPSLRSKLNVSSS